MTLASRFTEPRVFHLLLLGVFVPVLPLTWGAWMWSRRRARITGAHQWSRRLLALALVDTVVALAVLSLLFIAPTPHRLVRDEPTPIDARDTRPGSEGLFTPNVALEPGACVSAELARPDSGTLRPLALAVGLLALFGFLGRRHRPLRFLIPAVAVFALAWFVGGAARAGSCAALGGHAPGTFLLALLAHGLALASGGWWLARRVDAVPILAPLAAPRVVAAALYYTITWVPRAFVVVFAMGGIVAWLAQTGTPLDAFADSTLGVGGVLLLLLGGAFVGPFAEEVFFRGAVLPWLAGFTRPWVAITLSSVLFGALHVHHGLAIVGPLAVGMILGWARARSDGLRVPILLHAAFNAASILVFVILD